MCLTSNQLEERANWGFGLAHDGEPNTADGQCSTKIANQKMLKLTFYKCEEQLRNTGLLYFVKRNETKRERAK